MCKNFKMRLFNLLEFRLIKYKYKCLELAMHMSVDTVYYYLHCSSPYFLMRSSQIYLRYFCSQVAYVAIASFIIPTTSLTLCFLFSLIIAILVNTKWYFTAF